MRRSALVLLAPAFLLLAFSAPAEAGGSGHWQGGHPAYSSSYRHGPKYYGSRHLAPRHWSVQRGYYDGYRNGYRSGGHQYRPRHGYRVPRHAYPRHPGYRSHGYYKPYPRYRGHRYPAYGHAGIYLPPVWFGGVSLHFGY